tara:strand:+ start:94696 stop:97800 length:3105 start_codon:yes stop_codon:yes gene_type:complete
VVDPVFKPKLPNTASDGDQVLDTNGSVYEFNVETKEWIFKGQIPDPDVVTEEADGLVSPSIHSKLLLIQTLIARGIDFSAFKLDSPVENPYYYYFHSSDDLIKFSPEQSVTPKEVLAIDVISVLAPNEAAGTTDIVVTTGGFTPGEYDGLVLETSFGRFSIITNKIRTITITGANTNLRVGDSIKVVKVEERKNQLRLEVDRGRLYQKLLRNCCVGPKGIDGNQGAAGAAGTEDSGEVFQLPLSPTSGVFNWEAFVNAPIDTPISLRIFASDSDLVLLEVLYPISDDEDVMIAINDDDISIEQTNVDISYDSTSRIFRGSLVILEGGEESASWRYKTRQRGAKGADGQNGLSYLEINTSILDDPSLRGTKALTSIRKSTISDDLIILDNDLFNEVPTSNLGGLDGDTIRNVEEDFFAAAQVTISDNKSVGYFKFNPTPCPTPDLDLPLWTPTSDCVQSRRWSLYKFDWFNRVDPNYLFRVLLNPKPDENCCQEDFFFCPNVGDACEIEGEPAPPVPIPTPCNCDCENPIGDQFFGDGYVVDPIDLTDPRNIVDGISPEEDSFVLIGEGGEDNQLQDDSVRSASLRTVESVLDGTIQKFINEITACGNVEIRVAVDFDSDICGGEVFEREDCAFVDSNAVTASFLLESDGTAQITSTAMLESKVIPVVTVFTASTNEVVLPDVPPTVEPGLVAVPVEEGCVPEGVENPNFCTAEYAPTVFKLSAFVNTNEVNYCRGYRLTISARSDKDTCFKERTFIITDPGSSVIPVKELELTEGSDITEIGSEHEHDEFYEDVVEEEEVVIPPPPFVPVSSFAPDAQIVTDGILGEEIVTTSDYALGFEMPQFSISGTGDPSIFLNLAELRIGEILNTPSNSQVPILSDNLQNNVVLDASTVSLNKNDAGFDADGPFGRGTYILGSDFTTAWKSRIPDEQVRTDVWTDVIGFFSEPESEDEDFRFIMYARLSSSSLSGNGSSVFAMSLADSEIGEGVFIIESILTEDPMSVIADGGITFGVASTVSLSYVTRDISEIYPTIGI